MSISKIQLLQSKSHPTSKAKSTLPLTSPLKNYHGKRRNWN